MVIFSLIFDEKAGNSMKCVNYSINNELAANGAGDQIES